MKYRFISYGLIGNERDGYEVNDAHTTSQCYELSAADLQSDACIFQALKKQGFMKRGARVKLFSTEGDEQTIYLTYKGKPEGELRLEVDAAK